jgi:hypothetical protein
MSCKSICRSSLDVVSSKQDSNSGIALRYSAVCTNRVPKDSDDLFWISSWPIFVDSRMATLIVILPFRKDSTEASVSDSLFCILPRIS